MQILLSHVIIDIFKQYSLKKKRVMGIFWHPTEWCNQQLTAFGMLMIGITCSQSNPPVNPWHTSGIYYLIYIPSIAYALITYWTADSLWLHIHIPHSKSYTFFLVEFVNASIRFQLQAIDRLDLYVYMSSYMYMSLTNLKNFVNSNIEYFFYT